jgi:hypothetical protein
LIRTSSSAVEKELTKLKRSLNTAIAFDALIDSICQSSSENVSIASRNLVSLLQPLKVSLMSAI